MADIGGVDVTDSTPRAGGTHKRTPGLVLAAAAVLLSACGDGVSLKAGKVTDKDHNAAWTQLIPIYNAGCKCVIVTPIYHDEEWELTVENCEWRDKDGSCFHDEWNVSSGDFDATAEGDWVTRT